MYRFRVSFARATKVFGLFELRAQDTTRTPGRGGMGVVALC